MDKVSRPVWLVRLLRIALHEERPEGFAPLDARPCCQEAALRLMGRCDGVCCSSSEVQRVLDDFSEPSEQRDDQLHRT